MKQDSVKLKKAIMTMTIKNEEERMIKLNKENKGKQI